MKKRLIYSLSLLFLLFTLGSMATIYYIYRTTSNLKTVIKLHRGEIIRQNLVISAKTVQTDLYTTHTAFGKNVDEIVSNMEDLDRSVHTCLGCHHTPEMTRRLQDMNHLLEDYKEALSYLITTSADPARIQRLRTAAIQIGSEFMNKAQDMATVADKRLNEKTVNAINQISRSRMILFATLGVSFLIALSIAVTLTREMTEPIGELVSAARKIKSGELGYSTRYRWKDEFGELAGAFNEMSASLKASNEKVMQHLRSLSNLYSITLSFHSNTSVEDICRDVCSGAADLIRSGQSCIILQDAEKGLFRLLLPAQGIPVRYADMVSIESQAMERLYLQSRRKTLIMNGNLEGSPTREIDEKLGAKNLMFSWIRRKGTLIGALRLANKKEGDFTDDDGKLLAILANNFSVALENAELYADLKKRMAELHSTREQLIQAVKLAAIGELASNIAHEINNPLTSILGYSELIKEETDLDSIMHDIMIIEKESLRARDIVSRLLEFSRKKPLKIKTVDINALLDSTIDLASLSINDTSIEVVRNYTVLPLIQADEDQLKQVFLNLINNAVFAMGNEGTLTVVTYEDCDYAVIEVKDSGHGIPEDVLPRIFEPFFTTKDEKGTGLGLPISLKIVQSHGGALEAFSEEDKGSTFRIRLPKSPKVVSVRALGLHEQAIESGPGQEQNG
ncbi:MAG: ATP-binding protein [Nitrospiraceae bacterium]|nr:ATP-binding protein [Nitrospiraceae bacterium]